MQISVFQLRDETREKVEKFSISKLHFLGHLKKLWLTLRGTAIFDKQRAEIPARNTTKL